MPAQILPAGLAHPAGKTGGKILGTGCPNCQRLEKTTREVTEEMGVEGTLSKQKEESQARYSAFLGFASYSL
jgi:hypothetical protein